MHMNSECILYIKRAFLIPRWMMTKIAIVGGVIFFVMMFFYFLVTGFSLLESALLVGSLFFSMLFLVCMLTILLSLIGADSARGGIFLQAFFLSSIFIISAAIVSIFSILYFESFLSAIDLLWLLPVFWCVLLVVLVVFFFMVWKSGALFRALVGK